MVNLIVDLSWYEISNDDFDKIKKSVKKKKKSNITVYIFTDKINELYNLDQNKNKWIIQHNDLLFIFEYYLEEDNGIQKK